ncbi:hypothetical protein P280DRAFT_291762 [Massarina eburnea CBS 473.64]|uniref:Rhodopsin domain-containing protein n=1 Tax=Massarina eburnea CBS 473.64 TaxID=1395130 RepID=A0A6A6S3E2_9PLEO|nr:hypothetical protein P280DRAFT_291762 [Massarina eburnea CBS 473.64]
MVKGVTSPELALAVLVPMPFCIVLAILRFRIRLQRKAWGVDDWAMLLNIPFWLTASIASIGMAWSGVGAPDASLSDEEYAASLRWFYVFQEPWCFTLITIKWSIGFALVRIGNGHKYVIVVVYTCLAVVTIVMGGTGLYLFFQCSPVEKNWYTLIDGHCKAREIQTILSFTVAAVSITTDWIFAILPMFLLWNIQMDPHVKVSVVGLLGLGVFASIAPIVRLKYLVGLNDNSKLLQNLGMILAWATAEQNVGMIISNLPACRPLLTSFTSYVMGSKQSSNKSSSALNYFELDENRSKGPQSYKGGNETRIYGHEINGDYDKGLPADGGSQENIIGDSKGGAV